MKSQRNGKVVQYFQKDLSPSLSSETSTVTISLPKKKRNYIMVFGGKER